MLKDDKSFQNYKTLITFSLSCESCDLSSVASPPGVKIPLTAVSDLSYEVGGVAQPGRVPPPVVRLELHHGAVLLVRVVVTVLLVVTPFILNRQ